MKRDQIGEQNAPTRRGASKDSIRNSGENVKNDYNESSDEEKWRARRLMLEILAQVQASGKQ